MRQTTKVGLVTIFKTPLPDCPRRQAGYAPNRLPGDHLTIRVEAFRGPIIVYVRRSKGFRTWTPRLTTSETLRVASVIPFTFAVAASSASIVDKERLALMRPHSSATAWSISRMRSAKDLTTSVSHLSWALAFLG